MTATPEPTLATPKKNSITWRAVFIGLGGAIFVAAYTPYNDYVLNNTAFVGSHFPVGVTALMLLLVLAVNPILARLKPAAVLRRSELALIWSMMLIVSALPTSGLMRRLIPFLVVPIYSMPQHPEWEKLLTWLPGWLFPSTDHANDAVVTNFVVGAELDTWAAVPWGEWLIPCVAWGMFYMPLFVGCFLVSVLLAPQWIRNEKLQFPLATVMLELVDDPPPGRRLNRLLGDRRLWIAALLVILIHSIKGLHVYFPKVPAIPLQYNLSAIFTEDFWAHVGWWVKSGKVVFTMVGITFLMAREVSFSLWTMCLGYTLVLAIMQHQGVDPWEAMRSQNYGAFMAMGVFLLFAARRHLWCCLQATVGRSPPDPQDPPAMMRFAVIGLALCLTVCVVWLCIVGQPLWVAATQVIVLILTWLVLSRIVAETGMFAVVQRWWAENFLTIPLLKALSPQSQAIAVSTIMPVVNAKENIMPFAFNVQRMARPLAVSRWRPFVVLGVLTILIGAVVSGACLIAIYYQRGAVRTDAHVSMLVTTSTTRNIVEYADKPLRPGQNPVHMAIGAGMLIALAACRVRWAGWPLVPIALCLATSEAMMTMWLSVLIGWACKSAALRLGGVAAYHRLRPVFIGLVVGEVFMAGFWMAVGAIVRASGSEIGPYRVLPNIS